MGLEDEIEKSTFKDVAYSVHPITKEKLKGNSKTIATNDRLFHDFCWSPNKSISIAALVLGKTELIQAHNEAVEEMAGYIERTYGGCRDQSGGTEKDVYTGKMLFAALTHYTARPVKEAGKKFVDPQLHSHLLLMNTTKTDSGQWRALQHESLSSDNALGFLYNQILAEKVQERGFKIRHAADGFELADISDEQIAVFSKRTQQAKKKLKASGEDATSDAVHSKLLRIRQSKLPNLTLDDLKAQWIAQADGMQVTQYDRVERLGYGTAEEELQSAINHLSERSVNFHRSNIQHEVFRHVQRFSAEDLDNAIAAHPDLIELAKDRYSTIGALRQELFILDAWESGISTKEPLVKAIALEDLQQESWVDGKKIQLNPSQAVAIRNALQSTDQFQIIKGLAGVGKTTAIAAFIKQLKASGSEVELFGFAGTHEAKSELAKSLNIESRTVASLTTSGSEGRIWVIDEAGLNSNREWVEVLEMAKAQDVRVLMLGDPGQNSSVEAGSPMRSVMNKFPQTAQSMSKIIRQENPRQLRAVELISQGKGAAAIALLDKNGWLTQIEERKARAKAIADRFTEMPVKEMERTVVVSGTNAEREAITAEVRDNLKTNGMLGDSTIIKTLVSRNLSKQHAKEARNFKSGDWVKFHNAPREGFMRAGMLYKVTEVDGDILKIETVSGRRYSIAPSKFKGNIEALYEKDLEVAVGDRARFTATVRQNGWHNGKQISITKVSGEWIEATDGDGKKHRIDTLNPVSIDHDWVGTSYRRQGKTARNALVSLTNDPTSSQEPTTVSISRQTHHIEVFTENTDQLLRLVQKSNAQPNVLDELGTDKASLLKLKGAIAEFDAKGGKIRDYVARARSHDAWQPDYKGVECPENLEPHHWEEMKKSAIHPDLVQLNIESAKGMGVSERLLEDHFLELGAGQLQTSKMKKLLKQYEPLNNGGWWGKAGTDARTLLDSAPQLSTNGVFKGDTPRVDVEGKVIKYENPKGRDRPFFLANVPDWLAEDIYTKHGITPTASQKKSGFWHIVQAHNLPIVLVEGYKKALSVLSQGAISIGTPGITLYKSNEKGADGQNLPLPKRELLEDLKVFATPGRVITIANDQDTKPRTRAIVRQANVRSAEVIAEQGGIVRIATWNGADGKGADDLIAAHGPEVLIDALNSAKPWEHQADALYRSKYKALSQKAQDSIGPDATGLQIDATVYRMAIAQGDILDGMRYLKAGKGYEEGGEAYLQSVSSYIQSEPDRQRYQAIALQLKAELGNIPIERQDIEIYLRAGARVVSASPRVEVLAASDAASAQGYMKGIEAISGTYDRIKVQTDEEMLNKLIAQGVQGYTVEHLGQSMGIIEGLGRSL